MPASSAVTPSSNTAPASLSARPFDLSAAREEHPGAVHLGRQLIDRRRHDRDEPASFVPRLLFHPFADRGECLDPVAGIETGSVGKVLEPLAPRQAGVVPESPL